MAFAKKNQGAASAAPPASSAPAKPVPAAVAQAFNRIQSVETFAGFIFDPEHFPFTLLETFIIIANEIRELGLTKTGGKEKDATLKYNYFEEAEIVSHLSVLLKKHQIGFAAAAPSITNRFIAGVTYSGAPKTNIHVSTSIIFSHRESKEWIIIPGVGEATDSGDKAVTKAITSSDKYIYMKTFMISDGNDIELDQGQEDRPAAAAQSKSRTTSTNLKCSDCSKQIKGGKYKGQDVDAPTFAEATKGVFQRQLCADCAQTAKEKLQSGGSTTPPAKKATPPAKATPSKAAPAATKKSGGDEVDPDAGKIMELTLVEVKSRLINKGKPTEKSIRDLVFQGGLRITDWHESHYPVYDELDFTSYEYPAIIVYEAKQNGQYVNRDLKALMGLDGNRYENQDGTDYEPDQAVDTTISGTTDITDDNPITDDDIPF